MFSSSLSFVASPSLGRRRHLLLPITCRAQHGKTDRVVASVDVAPQVNLPGYTVMECPHLREYLEDLPSFDSPLIRQKRAFITPGEVILKDIVWKPHESKQLSAFERAGPREKVYFSKGIRAAIVSCGGICPGINLVIRELTLCLKQYGVETVFGVQHGYRGFFSENWREITEEEVEDKHKIGGTMLGSSRGGFELTKVVDALETRDISILFAIGGDGTVMGLQKVYHEVKRRRLKTAIVSIPKTIDNDIPILDRSFGFETAVDEAQRAIDAAYVEAISFLNCVSIVQLMGRNSGFIACHAALASREVDICLIPEDPFAIHGPGGVLEHIEKVLREKGHCVIVVAEGAGYEYVGDSRDIGRYLVNEVNRFAKTANHEITSKYIDPTYQLRALPTIASDKIFCTLLAHSAVHGAYAGYTGFSVGPVNNRNAYIPIDKLAGIQRKVDTGDRMWQRLVASTGQPEWAPPPAIPTPRVPDQ